MDSYSFLTHAFFETCDDIPPGAENLPFIFGEPGPIEDRVYTVALSAGQLREVRDALNTVGSACESVRRPRGDRHLVQLNRQQISAIVRACGLYCGTTIAIRNAILDPCTIPEAFKRLHLLPKRSRDYVVANMRVLDRIFVVRAESAHV